MSVALPLFSRTELKIKTEEEKKLIRFWWFDGCYCCCRCWTLSYHLLLNASALFCKNENSKFQVNFVNKTFVFYCVDCLLRSFFHCCLSKRFILALAPVFVPIIYFHIFSEWKARKHKNCRHFQFQAIVCNHYDLLNANCTDCIYCLHRVQCAMFRYVKVRQLICEWCHKDCKQI